MLETRNLSLRALRFALASADKVEQRSCDTAHTCYKIHAVLSDNAEDTGGLVSSDEIFL